MIRNKEAILALEATADLSAKDGYFVKASTTKCALVTAVNDVPLGVITSGDVAAGNTSVALPNFGGIVSAKVGATPGTIALGTKLMMNADGTVRALTASAGTYFYVAIALETGAANELIAVRLIEPIAVTVA